MSGPLNRDNHNSRVDDEGSVVSGSPGRQLTAIQKVGVAGLVLVVFLSFIWIGRLNNTTGQAKRQPDIPLVAGGAFRQAPAAPLVQPTPASMPMPAANSTPSVFAPPQQHQMTAAESPIFAFQGGGGVADAVAGAAAAASSPAALLTGAPGGTQHPADQPSALSTMLKPTVLSGAKARLLPHPDMVVTMGTIIPCTLQTAIDSQLAGYVKCVLPQAVRSTTGNVVLLDRGTAVVGEIGRGLVQGQDRVFVLWDRAETPDHAVIELSSPGTDELGRSGLPGAVNNHWWKRFGGAIMLSMINGGLQAGTALAANSGGGTGGSFFNSFQSNGTNVADTALQATINIPPTLEKNQGDNVAIFVAKDLDFSDVYNLRVTGAGDAQ
jgi:type IV secretion system protein VirB10